MVKMLAFLLLFPVTSLWARWQQPDHAPYHILQNSVLISIEPQGKFTRELTFHMKVLKDFARELASKYVDSYNESTTTVEILEAYTKNEGQKIPVEQNQIEDKPLASSEKGFDQIRQLMVIFPQVQVGSEIFLKYKVTTSSPYKPLFDDLFSLPPNSYFKNFEIQINSALPLFYQVHDPEQFFKITSTANPFSLNIKLQRPFYRATTGEVRPYLPPALFPQVRVGNTSSWKVFADQLAPTYQQEISRPLPPQLLSIAQQAAKINNLPDRINFITSSLASNFTYMGDWRSIGGAQLPRPMADFVKSGLGDCKDFSVATVAILRHLKIPAFPAVIFRGANYDPPPLDYPYAGDFNHLIVWVVNGKEKIWVDPTNFTSFAPNIYPDIAGRKALVLETGNSHLRYTPKLDPKFNQTVVEKTFHFQGPNQATVDGTLQLKGPSAIFLTGAELNDSKENIEFSLIELIASNIKLASNWTCQPFQLVGRQVRNLKFQCQYQEEFFLQKVLSQNVFSLDYPSYITLIMQNLEQRVADIFLGQAREEMYLVRLEHQKIAAAIKPQNCSITTRWMDASRRFESDQQNIVVKDRYLLRASNIRQTDFSLPEFRVLRSTLAQCFYNFLLPIVPVPLTNPKGAK